jgi:hypothetical protein
VSLESWIAFCPTEAALCFVPGLAVLYVVARLAAVRTQ